MKKKEQVCRRVENNAAFEGKRREFLKCACVFPAFFSVCFFQKKNDATDPGSFSVWQLPSQTGIQMMSYVLRSADGRVAVVDGGWTEDGAYLKGFLAALGNRVDAWFITHSHSDHIDALTWILKSPGNLEIENIYASFPPLDWLKKYDQDATESLEDFNRVLEATGKTYRSVNIGDVFDLGGVRIEILSVANPEITVNAANNSSMTFRVSGGGKTVLFTGDIGAEASMKILKNVAPQKLKADYVQMTHHGQGGAVRDFYETVNPDFCLWPTPLWLWENNKGGGGYNSGPWTTLETREWMKDLGVKKHVVSGIDGLTEIK